MGNSQANPGRFNGNVQGAFNANRRGGRGNAFRERVLLNELGNIHFVAPSLGSRVK